MAMVLVGGGGGGGLGGAGSSGSDGGPVGPAAVAVAGPGLRAAAPTGWREAAAV